MFGPFSVASVPVLIIASISLVVYPLMICSVLDKHRDCLNELSNEKDFASIEIREAQAPLITFDDITKVRVV